MAKRADHRDPNAAVRVEVGLTEERGAKAFFALAAEAARSQFDPVEQWDEFFLALWNQVEAGFGLIDEDPGGAQGTGEQWSEHANDPSVVSDEQ